MLKLHVFAWMFSVAMIFLNTDVVSGQNYPNKPIRLITSGAGGAGDSTSRLIAESLSRTLGQSVLVENRAGASGIIAAQTVTKAPPDGYTLLVYGATIWLLPFLQDNVPYDPVKDFSPIAVLTIAPSVIVVHPSVPVKTVKELIALAKARPGELNYGSAGPGSISHLATELFKARAGVNLAHVPYKSAAQSHSDLMSGQIQLSFPTAGPVIPYVKSQRLRALAVTSAKRSEMLPEVPTVVASGLPGYVWETISGIFAPAQTPEAIIIRLNQEIVRVLNRADVKEKFLKNGVETVGSSPEVFAAKIKSDMATVGKVIKDVGIRAE